MTIFDFKDYRPYLQKYIDQLPRRGRGEMNRWAQAMGVHPSLVSQVLAGLKNLSLEQAQLCSEHLHHSKLERDYFLVMVQFQRAGSEKLRSYFKNQMDEIVATSKELESRVQREATLTPEELAVFYSHWLYAATWLQTSLPQGKSITELMGIFQIAKDRANEICQFLVETRLCVVQDGKFVMGPQSIHLGRGSPHLPKHHTNWRLKAIESSDRIADDEMMYTGPMSLSKDDCIKVRAQLVEVVRQITDRAIASNAEEAVCLNIDFFRIKR